MAPMNMLILIVQLIVVDLNKNAAFAIVSKGKKSKPNEVEAISGATISSKAVVKLLNQGLDQWQAPIDTYLNEQVKKQQE